MPRLEFSTEPHPLGRITQRGSARIFFGNRDSTAEAVESSFAGNRLAILKQVHSDRVVAGQPNRDFESGIEADAQWTNEPGLALCIRTADCLPILFASGTKPLVAAAHAGWRGVASGIIGHTIQALIDQGAQVSDLAVWIGPHIGPRSFEVGKDVADQLLKADQKFCHHLTTVPVDDTPAFGLLFSGSTTSSAASGGSILLPHNDPEKRFVNLGLLVRRQLLAAGVEDEQIWWSSVDTMTNPNYHSYRREAAQSGRQLSLVCLG